MLNQIKLECVNLHLELPKNQLVSWTSGNISIRDPLSGFVVIKPSGVKYEALTAEMMVVLDLDGNIVEGNLRPSSDTTSHLVIYRNRSDIHAIVHTHSPYATAFAALNRSIPVYLTAHADEFGEEIPCGDFAMIGNEEIGNEVVKKIGSSKAILLSHHGVFTIGATGESAVKTAVMVEDIARTVWFALQIGQPTPIPPDWVARFHHRYKQDYGQG